MAHVPAKFHPDIFNIKTKLDNYDYAYNNKHKWVTVIWNMMDLIWTTSGHVT